jgi:RNA polymerase sigma factor (sigma-70 family)
MVNDSVQLIACIPRLRRYARALVGNRAEADDLVQDTMERGWNKLTSWRRDSDMRAWLFGIMHNLWIDQARKRHMVTEEWNEHTLAPTTEFGYSDQLEVRDLDTALRLLPVEQKEILLLVALEGMTYEEVASTLRIPLGTVMSRLARGRERLRVLMDGRFVASPLKVVK